ncbi:MAG: flagellar motor switch protein FliN [Desulfobacterales bacterium]|jgi:flagellar motor switch protein FliN/FliY
MAENNNPAPPSDAQPGSGAAAVGQDSDNLEFILDIPLDITVELGRTRMVINDLLKLGQGSVIELTKMAGETLDIMANQKLIAKGEVVVVKDKYGVRLTEVISPMERIEGLQ